jgi:hypothetical protein
MDARTTSRSVYSNGARKRKAKERGEKERDTYPKYASRPCQNWGFAMPAWYMSSSCSARAGVALSSVRVTLRVVLFWRERVEGKEPEEEGRSTN